MLHSKYFWILTGALGLFLGMPNPFLHIPFAVLLYPVSLYMLSKISDYPFRDGVLCGLIGASFCMYWISVAVYVYGNYPWILAIPCTIVMGAYIGLWGGVFSSLMRRILVLDPFLRALAAALLWYICEWLRSFLFTGFSWLTLSSAFAPMPEFIQGASLIGAFGLSGIFAGIGVLLAESFTRYTAFQKGHAHHTKHIVYNTILSFSGVFCLVLLSVYGSARLESSFESDAFLYGANREEPYTSIKETVVYSANYVDFTGQASDPIENRGGNAINRGEFLGDYKEYHKNPQRIGPVKNTFVLPRFSQKILEKDIEMIELRDDIPVAKNFLEQDDILLFTVVQGNVSQAVKWEKSFQFATAQKYIRLSEQGINFVENFFPFVNFKTEPLWMEAEQATPNKAKPASANGMEKPVKSTNMPGNKSANMSANMPGNRPASSPSLFIPSVILWPETALPFYFSQASPLTAMVEAFAMDKNIVFGAPGVEFPAFGDEGATLHNRLFFLQSDNMSFYDKEHLVPFGEYMPELPFLSDILSGMLQGIGGFSAGNNEALLTLMLGNQSKQKESGIVLWDENQNAENKQEKDVRHPQEKERAHPLSALICYEAIFPQIAQEDVQNGAELFINVSNDAWYERTSALEQHLHLSLMRAVEQKRFLVRAGNTGISAFVDDYGRIMTQSDLFTDETLSGFVALRTEKTVYHRLATYLPFLALCLYIILFIFAQVLKQRFQKVSLLE